MRIFYQIAAHIRQLFHSRAIDRDMSEELQFHVDAETARNVARGMPAEEAHRRARITVGSFDVAQERARDERPGAAFRQIGRDIGFGFRLMRKSPA